MPEGNGKYGALCDFVRIQTQATGGVGAILIVIEGLDDDTVRAHVSVQVQEEIKEQVPKMLLDLVHRIESEQTIERFLELVAAGGADEGDKSEGE